MAKRSQYKIQYRVEWESDEILKDWIQPIPNDDRKVKCKYCQVVMSAYYAGLCSHANDKKHLKKTADHVEPGDLGFISEQTKQEFSWLELYPDNAVVARCLLCNMEIIVSEESVRNHASSADHVKNTSNLDVKIRLKYQKRWHMNPLFADWLAPVEGDVTKARCLYCFAEIRAHYRDLERHMKTQKHVRCAQTIAGRAEKITATDDEYECAMDVKPDLQLDPSDANEVMSFTRKEKPKAEKLENVRLHSTRQVTVPLPSSNEEDDESQLLELECETVDEPNITALTAPQQSCSAKIQKDTVLRNSDNGQSELGRVDQTNKETSGNADAITSQIVSSAQSVIGSSIAGSAEVRLVKFTGHEAAPTSCLKPERPSLTRDCLELPSKRRKLDQAAESELDMTDVISNIKYEEASEHPDDMYSPGEADFTDDQLMESEVNPKKTKTNIDWRRYKKVYRREWELDPALSDWVAPIDGDRYKAACKFCGCVLRAHYTDLRQHRKTAKHNRNAYWHKNQSKEPVAFENCSANASKVQDDMGDRPSKESKVSACYMLSKSPWSRYRKRYRKQWETDPQFQGWIASVPGDDTKARCKYCRVLLRAHFADLKNHGQTTKHANNIAYGQPFEDCLPVNRAVYVAPRMPTKPNILSRKKKTSLKDLSAGDSTHNFDLNRPDDSLAPIANITNLTSFGWGSSTLQETTLILPKHIHLDEHLAASLPKRSPSALFRVKKEPGTTDAAGSAKKRKDKPLLQTTQEECTENALQSLTKSVTLWEFLMMKVEKSHPNSTRPTLETVLLEFKALQEQVRGLSHGQLMPIAADDASDDAFMIGSDELAHCLGVPVGAYKIKDSTNPRMTRNTNLLHSVARRRARHNPTAVGLSSDQTAIANSIQKFITSREAEIQPLVIPSDQLQGVKFISYDVDGQYTDCSGMYVVNGHEGLYVLPVTDDIDAETINTFMAVPVANAKEGDAAQG